MASLSRSGEATTNGANVKTQNQAPTKATQVFAITELAELILLRADHHNLRNSLQRVSTDLRDTISGSTKLKRRLYIEPKWDHHTVCLAPIPSSMVELTSSSLAVDGSTLTSSMRFSQSALYWACHPENQAITSAFRNMLTCQPPAIAVQLVCMSTSDKFSTKATLLNFANNDGITVGEIFDLVNGAKPCGPVTLTYTFRPKA